MKRFKWFLLSLCFAIILISCSGGGGGDGASPTPEANFEIVSVEKTTTSYNSPSLMIMVKNTGNAAGYNVSCDANALDSAGIIIDTAIAFFASSQDIEVAQSAQNEAVFFDLSSHNDYVSLEYNCDWLTRD